MRATMLLLLLTACTDHGDPIEPVSPSTVPPPAWGVPISGGTLLVTRDGHAVIADPDRDRVVSVTLDGHTVAADRPLLDGDEPGRLVEDGAGRIHVALRRGGALITFADAASLQIVERRAVCPEPRGVAYDAAADRLHVACAGGELVTLPAAGGEAVRRLRLDRDLRDVIVRADGSLAVTRFRSAEILTVDAGGTITGRTAPPVSERDLQGDAIAAVAWRTVSLVDGRLLVLHQRQVQGVLAPVVGGYGAGCTPNVVETALTLVLPDGRAVSAKPVVRGALAIDVAPSPDGRLFAVVVAGRHQVQIHDTTVFTQPELPPFCGEVAPATLDDDLGMPTSVAFGPSGDILIFYPEVPALVAHDPTSFATRRWVLRLPGGLGYDSGRALFHTETPSQMACASCHPEGREDGLVWDFVTAGPRRTQTLTGHLLGRAPFHWSADRPTLDVLMDDVFSGRMSGGPLTGNQRLSLARWLDRIPSPGPSPGDAAALERGKSLFAARCRACHGGELATDNSLRDVGTGARFKVPSLLGVAARAPFLHDGCAESLDEAIGPCGGGESHTGSPAISEAEVADVVAYLGSL